MINYSQLPKYTNTHLLSNGDLKFWDKKIDDLKIAMINPLIESGNPKFKNKFDFDFTKLKQWINDDIVSLVKYFLLCLKELRFKKVKEARMLVSLLIGQQEYKEDNVLKELKDGIDYGHLRKLEEIYMKYKNTEDQFYLNMMETLCKPYLDVMRNVIYMCEDLFKGQSFDFDFFSDEKQEDYIKI